MKLSTTYSKIRCFFGKHDWKYNNPKDDTGEYIEFSRFCNICYLKQKRNIFDLGRGMIWVRTKKYTKQELREINLKRILG
jgi:hypothetical protein